ncbi:MAG: 3-methyl-2-oxobutanoate hydroxymethyltransferase [Oligoflexales bacterium]
MSSHSQVKRTTLDSIVRKKKAGEKIVMVTCYDAAFGRIVNETSVDLVLVGDSLGNVILGHENTIPVTVNDIIHHTKAVTRTVKRPLVIADMPFFSYHVSKEQALENASRIMQESGCQAVKLEGGEAIAKTVEALSSCGIPVMGHLGLTPQSLHQLSGYKVQGKTDEAARLMIKEAKRLQDAGAFSLVLELIPAELARQITAELSIPTIGIGAGSDVDGQVLVLHDLLGFDTTFKPKFLKHYANIGEAVHKALEQYAGEVRERKFPEREHSFYVD